MSDRNRCHICGAHFSDGCGCDRMTSSHERKIEEAVAALQEKVEKADAARLAAATAPLLAECESWRMRAEKAEAELSACKESPGGCGYWREAAKARGADRERLRKLLWDGLYREDALFGALERWGFGHRLRLKGEIEKHFHAWRASVRAELEKT